MTNLIEKGYGDRVKHFIRVLDSENRAWKTEKQYVKPKKIELTKNTVL
ncbi:MAG: hypothetical protein ACLR71_19705 [[Clostridium] scindens]